MKLTNLYFVRHAHSAYSTDEMGRPLSQRGLHDAKKITHLLEKENIDIVISSPYKRAIQTVAGIADSIGKEVLIEEGFKERILSETPVKDFQFAIAKVWENPPFFWEGGESNLLAQQREVKATLKVLEQYGDNNIAIGTHGNLLVLIMQYFDGSYGFSFWKALQMPDIYKLTFENRELKDVNRIWQG